MTLKTLAFIFAAGAAASFAAVPAQAAPAVAGGIAQAPDPLLQDVQHRTFIYRGRPYCFYFDGWHGAGWYRCGWNWRRGYGWGGVYGWNDWEYGPAFRRFGHHRHYGRNWNGRNWNGGNWSGKSYSGRGGNWQNRNSSVRTQPPSGTKATTGFGNGAAQGGGKMSAPSVAAPSRAPAASGGSFGGGGGKGGGGSGGGSGGSGGSPGKQ